MVVEEDWMPRTSENAHLTAQHQMAKNEIESLRNSGWQLLPPYAMPYSGKGLFPNNEKPEWVEVMHFQRQREG
jgi:hypothetical protein